MKVITLAVFLGNGIPVDMGRNMQQRFESDDWRITLEGDYVRMEKVVETGSCEVLRTNAPVVLYECEEPVKEDPLVTSVPAPPETKPEPESKRDRRGRRG